MNKYEQINEQLDKIYRDERTQAFTEKRRANADKLKYDGTVEGRVYGSLLHLQIDFQEQFDARAEEKLSDWLDYLAREFPDDFRR